MGLLPVKPAEVLLSYTGSDSLDTNSKKKNRPVGQFMKQLALEFPEASDASLEAPDQKVNA